DSAGSPLLVVEDRPEVLLLFEKFLRGSGFHVIPAATLEQARHALRQVRPAAIVLDILLRGQDAWGLLAELKRAEDTRSIPVIVVTAVDDERKGLALGADAYVIKPVQRRWLLEKLRELTGSRVLRRVLIIDDDEVSRYLVRDLLDDFPCILTEAATGREGLREAREGPPDAIFLDLVMPDMSGYAVLEHLKKDPTTREVPVIVVTSRVLENDEQAALRPHTVAVLSKAAPRHVAVATIHEALARAGLWEDGV
ncbi:MAG: response regulator, partial [Dehalococcoidia bacterium]|nr:response regulator [Dehalococcoidia bacterium]